MWQSWLSLLSQGTLMTAQHSRPCVLRNFSTTLRTNIYVKHGKSSELSTQTIAARDILICHSKGSVGNVRSFHTSPRRPIHPILLLFIKPIAKMSAALGGRHLRKRYQALNSADRLKFWALVRRRWYIPASGVGLLGSGAAAYYYSHIEEAPITGRKRFMVLTHDQIMKVAVAEAEQLVEDFKEKQLPPTSKECARVFHVMDALTKANPELTTGLPFEKWTVFVVEDEAVNAFVLPNGYVFALTGMLNIASTQDELAIILGHEMAHAVLDHAMEELSYLRFLDYFIIACMAAIWCILPWDGLAVVTNWFYNKVIKLSTHLPHSRLIEQEADRVGLQFAAKACFDTRYGSLLWRKMAIKEKADEKLAGDLLMPEWMSTHPDSEKRAKHLDFLLPKALEFREGSCCPRLPDKDPRDFVKLLEQQLNEAVVAQKTGQNLKHVQKVPPPKIVIKTN